MNISIQFRKYESYDLSKEDHDKVSELMLETLKPVTLEIYEKFAHKHDSPFVANQMLAHVKKRLFKDSDAKVVMRLPQGERKNIGTILNHVRIKIEDKEIPLADHVFHMSVIQLGKAFIKIK
jgi:hypothetical protein